MFSNYLKLAFRNLLKNKLYTGLNISGLAIGVAACMLILLYVAHEVQYDRWNPNADRIVRPVYEIKIEGFNEKHGTVDAVVGPDAAAALPEIETYCRIRNSGSWQTRRDGQAEQQNREEKTLMADSTFFAVFPLEIVAGSARNSLNQPGTVAISRSRAMHYFGSPGAALGQTLLLGRTSERRQVSAVFEDVPENTHFHADLLMTLSDDEELKKAKPYWGYTNNFFTYFLLREHTDKATFTRKFEALAADKVSILLKDLFATSTADFEKSGKLARFELQNLGDIHLYSNKQSELDANGNIRYVWIFSAIAFFILLIACINFMNLATARSGGRAREVGVRKALGSSRMALAGQFLTESLALAGIAMLLAVGLAAAALPGFNELAGQQLSMPWSSPLFWVSLLGSTLAVGLLAGSYPAFFLSAFNTIKVLKGNKSGGFNGGGSSLRNGLVVFQFAISMVLIVSTVLVYSQLRYIQQKNLGFDKSQVLILENANALGRNANILMAELQKDARVENATRGNYLPLPNRNRENAILSVTKASGESDNVFQRWRVDADYLRTLGMKIKEGRDFNPALVTDSAAIIINETAARELGLADPVGQTLYTSKTKEVQSKAEDFETLTIIGVVQDFHFESLHDNIGGLYLQLSSPEGPISVRLKPGDAAGVIAGIERNWQQFNPDRALSYHFMDETLNRMYASEQRIGIIALVFALLSILVSCLGLFGLAAFTTEQRSKEIGVRKVLGASVVSITSLLTRDFLKLVALAFLLASPVAYWGMQKWLTDFAYHIDIQWWMFAVAGLAATAVAFATVSFQSIKAALANPVNSLRNE